ncbi:hybrid sensor histidine kinase/response regulator [Prosthecomicrobium sp. N25]|uniref:hybrid sensor histidine kinase/response regulator n=1 Tax=Prosthecomicrobium sp. N25 TaxID=3129254 RepID=UPI0030782333
MSDLPASHHAWSYVLDEQIRILFVDDDMILAEFAKVHLSTPTALVESCKDGVEAWERLTAEDFDIALVDIEMPQMDGLELVGRIRADQRLRHLPVIMVTGREDVVSIDRSFEMGATAFATKPVNWRQLSHQIRYVMRNSRMDRDVREARDRAEQLSALKTNLLAAMRHEFRTPLSTIIGFTDLMRGQLGAGASVTELVGYLDFINAAGKRLLSTFSDMLQYAQMMSNDRALEAAEYRLDRLVEAAVGGVGASPGTSPAAIAVEIAEPGLEITCDRELVTNALRHLLENAVSHGRGIDCRIAAGRDGAGDLVFTVEDGGPGIDPARVEACLEAFTQSDMSTTRQTGGLGLGLAIARGAADLHGGRLQVAARSPEPGTAVRLVLPRRCIFEAAEDDAPVAPAASASSRSAA